MRHLIICACLVVAGVTMENVCVMNSTLAGASDLLLENVESLSVSARGAECDASNQNICKINGVGEGTGRLISF